MSTVCISCGKETNNPKFCSRSCAARTNNKLQVKRKLEGTCHLCASRIMSSRKYCKKCFSRRPNAMKDMTLEEAIYEKHHKSSAFALVRSRARATKKAMETKACERCGWDKHVEVCHKKPISEYPKTTLVSEINSEDNLLILCPNCHWLFDHPT